MQDTVGPIIKEYCETHGYDCIIQEWQDPSKGAPWGKIKYAIDNISKYDWVWTMDIDTMIMNHSIKIEDIVNDEYCVMLSSLNGSIEHINTGSMFYKNDEKTIKFLNDIYDQKEFYWNGYWEQDAIIKLLKTNPEYRQITQICSHRKFNSHFHFDFDPEKHNYKSGDLLVHLCGSDNDFRHQALLQLKNYIIRPYKEVPVKVWGPDWFLRKWIIQK
jgi:mannan polymerase II complex MNN10 subunit